MPTPTIGPISNLQTQTSVSPATDNFMVNASNPGKKWKVPAWPPKYFAAMSGRLRLQDDILYFRYDDRSSLRPVVPPLAASVIAKGLHMHLGHADQSKTEKTARQRFWWPDIKRDVTTCNNCAACARIARPEGGAWVSLSVVGVDLMVLDSENVVAGDFSREANSLYEICHKWRGGGRVVE